MSAGISKFLISAIIALALIGFADSTFLFAKRIAGTPIPCVLGFTGCDEVAKSPYSTLFGVPLAALGVAFYLAIGILTITYADTKKILFVKLLLGATAIGFLMSAYFIYVQAFLIKAFCMYCVISAVISTALLALGITLYRKTVRSVMTTI
jgi:uncharacterized membrane protein